MKLSPERLRKAPGKNRHPCAANLCRLNLTTLEIRPQKPGEKAGQPGRLFRYPVSACSRTCCLIGANITPQIRNNSEKAERVMSVPSRQRVREPCEHGYGKAFRAVLLSHRPSPPNFVPRKVQIFPPQDLKNPKKANKIENRIAHCDMGDGTSLPPLRHTKTEKENEP